LTAACLELVGHVCVHPSFVTPAKQGEQRPADLDLGDQVVVVLWACAQGAKKE
jgi:hypothetical protein